MGGSGLNGFGTELSDSGHFCAALDQGGLDLSPSEGDGEDSGLDIGHRGHVGASVGDELGLGR